MYKIIALDMDGTLLNDQKVITERTKEALTKAREKGVKVVLASGRPVDGLKKYLSEFWPSATKSIYILEILRDSKKVIIYCKCFTSEDILSCDTRKIKWIFLPVVFK